MFFQFHTQVQSESVFILSKDFYKHYEYGHIEKRFDNEKKNYLFVPLHQFSKFDFFMDSVGAMPPKYTNRYGHILKFNFDAQQHDNL